MFSASGRTEKEAFLNGSRKNTGIALAKLLSLVLPILIGASLSRAFHTLPNLCRWPMGRYPGSIIPGNRREKNKKKRARSPKIMPVLRFD